MKSYLDKLSTLLLQALKRLSRMPGYTLLSMLGLIISLSGTVIIARYLHQEWTIDHWMPDLDRTYIIAAMSAEADDGRYFANTGQISPNDEKPRPQQESSLVECYSDVFLPTSLTELQTADGDWYPINMIYADTMFSEVYPLRAVEGTLKIQAPEDAIVSEELARRIFPDGSAVGQTLSYNKDVVYKIVGVFRQPGTKSLMRFDMAGNASMSTDRSHEFSIIKLHEGARMEDFNASQKPIKINGIYEVYYRLFPYGRPAAGTMSHFGNIPSQPTICPSTHLWMLFGVGVLLFFVGIFNFLNLYAVMRHTREHEMKVRRIFGASRWNIFSMLYVESLLISAPAMLGVWVVIELTTPHMKEWFDIEQMVMPGFDIGLTLGIMFLLPLLATRPSPNPSLTGRGRVTTTFSKSEQITPSLQGRVRGGSVGGGSFLFLQYFISLTLITVSLYLMRQLHMMMDTDPGYKTEGLLTFEADQNDHANGMYYSSLEELQEDYRKMNEKRALWLTRMAESPYIRHVEIMPDFLYLTREGGLWLSEASIEGRSGTLLVCSMSPNQFEMCGLSLLEGRMFCDSLDRDVPHVILNESALRILGIKDWRQEKLPMSSNFIQNNWGEQGKTLQYDIVGIVRDFHPGKLSEPQMAIGLVYKENLPFLSSYFLGKYMVETEPGCEAKAAQLIRDTNKEFYGRDEMSIRWVSDDIKELYREDRRTAHIFFTFALLAIGVTCLGVLGLMMFDVRRRYREIALRKVHGARFRDIALLLSRRYLIVLALAAAVSIPVSLIGLHQLITRYYTIHATIAWWIPLVSLLIVFLLSALTLWHQIWRATKIEPSIVMKVE